MPSEKSKGPSLKERRDNNTACILAVGLLTAAANAISLLHGPIARSLARCDVPVKEEQLLFGSEWCGDRLQVIGQGAALFAAGRSIEHVARAVMTLLVSATVGMLGHKLTLLMSSMSLVMSTGFLFCAVMGHKLGRGGGLYLVACWLHGCAGGEMLLGLVLEAGINTKGIDAAKVTTFKDQVLFLAAFSSTIIAAALTAMDLVDYAPVALFCFSIAIGASLFAMFHFPELESDAYEMKEGELQGAARSELQTYREVVGQSPVLRWALLESFMCGPLAAWMASVEVPMLLAYSGFTQEMATTALVPPALIGLACAPLMGKACRLVGFRRGLLLASLVPTCATFSAVPLAPFSSSAVWARNLASALVSGLDPLWLSARLRMAAPRHREKARALMLITSELSAALANLAYRGLFDARAVSWWGRSGPAMFCLASQVLGRCLWFFVVTPRSREAVDELEREAISNGNKLD